MHTIYFDGACEYWNGKRNPGGIATFAWLIKDEAGNRLAYGYGEAGRGGNISNNVAEYTALIKALEAYRSLGLSGPLEVRGDSQLVVNQVKGEWRCNHDHLRRLRDEADELLGLCDAEPLLCWIPREQNEEADHYSKLAYDLARKMPAGTEPWEKRFKVKELALSEVSL